MKLFSNEFFWENREFLKIILIHFFLSPKRQPFLNYFYILLKKFLIYFRFEFESRGVFPCFGIKMSDSSVQVLFLHIRWVDQLVSEWFTTYSFVYTNQFLTKIIFVINLWKLCPEELKPY